MGKKNLRRRSAKPSKSSSEIVLIPQLHVNKELAWLADQIRHCPAWNYSTCGASFFKLIRFWAEGSRSSRFMDFARFLFVENRGMHEFKHAINSQFRIAVILCLDRGKAGTAMNLIGTLQLLRYVAHSVKEGASCMAAILSNVLVRFEFDGEIIYDVLDLALISYYAKNRVKMIEWLLEADGYMLEELYKADGTEALLRQQHEISKRIETFGYAINYYARNHSILYIRTAYTGNGAEKNSADFTLSVRSTITLKALIMLVMSRIAEPPLDIQIFHEDKCGYVYDKLSLQCSGGKTLSCIGIESSDVVRIVDATTSSSGENEIAAKSTNVGKKHASKPVKRKTRKKSKPKPSEAIAKNNAGTLIANTAKPVLRNPKKQRSRSHVHYATNIDQNKVKHSKLLTLVFEQASELFRERRQRLNDLALKKSLPKDKSTGSRLDCSLSASRIHCCLSDDGEKAGKTFFPVIVGQDEFLYTSSKSLKHVAKTRPVSIDLHGCTRKEALHKLNCELPFWIDTAVKEHPWTVRVDIISGAGSQVVAKGVEQWIRENR